MSPIAIQTENVSKRYIIGHKTEKEGLRHVIERGLAAPVNWARRGFKRDPVRREEFWALRDVSFTVNEGEVVGIIGRNGAGKSTLLKVLSRITEQTEGRIRLRGRLASLLEVGTGFHPELSGRENIYLNGAILGMTRQEIKRKFDEIVAFAEVEKFLDTPVKRYSSGMYVRLAFAVAAHLEPEILVVDEVLAVGDVNFQAKCLGKMEDVGKSGRTVLFVSHNMAMISRLCSRAIMLRQGRLVADAPTQGVIEQYLAEGYRAAETQLAQRTDRFGTGRARAVELAVCNDAGRACDHVSGGQAVRFRLRYRSEPDAVGAPLHATVVCKRDDQVCFVLSTAMIRPEPMTLEREGVIELRVPELPLVGALYVLEFHLHSEQMKELYDAVETAATLTVIDGDYFGTGRLRPSQHWKQMGVLVRHEAVDAPAADPLLAAQR